MWSSSCETCGATIAVKYLLAESLKYLEKRDENNEPKTK